MNISIKIKDNIYKAEHYNLYNNKINKQQLS